MGFSNQQNQQSNFPRGAQQMNNPQPGIQQPSGFTLGVRHAVPDQNSDNVYIFGWVVGTVTVGDAVYVHNFGDDYAPTLLSTVLAIRKESGEMPRTAANCYISFLLENAKSAQIKSGTVLFTQNMTVHNVRTSYVDALSAVYVPEGNLRYKPEDAERLSTTDCEEILRIYSVRKTEQQNPNPEMIAQNQAAEAAFMNLLAQKLLAVRTIYGVYNRRTAEPHLFSYIYGHENGSYSCSEPMIMLITQAVHGSLINQVLDAGYDVREIKNEDNQELKNFLGNAFYVNGACGVRLNFSEVPIQANLLIAPPDFSNVPEISRPIMNPDLVRWILLVDQLDSIDDEAGKLAYSLYSGLLAEMLLKAKFLVPMRYEGEMIPVDEKTGQNIFKQGGRMLFSVVNGKTRPAIKMYTDWRRFNEAEGNDWKGMIETPAGMIERFDCIINPRKDGGGIYIDKELFVRIKERA